MAKQTWGNTWRTINWNKSEAEILGKVKLLLSAGADVNMQEYVDGWTALMIAIDLARYSLSTPEKI